MRHQHFRAISEVYEKRKLLEQELETNKSLSQTERTNLEKEISAVDKELELVKKNKPEIITEW